MNIRQAFGTSTPITITLNGLASSINVGRESAFINFDVDGARFLDALVDVTLVAGGTIGNDRAAYIFAYGSEDGVNYTDNATGVDAAITLRDPTNLRLVHVVAMPVVSATYRAVFSIAAAFGGVMPRRWGIVVRNFSGSALAVSGNSARFTGIFATAA